jgi:hypothetical protein
MSRQSNFPAWNPARLADQIDEASRAAHTPATCTCGHLRGDHQSARTGFPHPPRYGLCHVTGCGCREYAEQPRKTA